MKNMVTAYKKPIKNMKVKIMTLSNLTYSTPRESPLASISSIASNNTYAANPSHKSVTLESENQNVRTVSICADKNERQNNVVKLQLSKGAQMSLNYHS